MAKQKDDAGEVHEAEEIVGVKLVACDQAAEVEEPREEALDLPSPPVAPKCATVLGVLPATVAAVRCNQLDAPLPQSLIEWITVVGPIREELLGQLVEEALVKRRLDQLHFMRRSTVDPNGERKTKAVCHCHDLGPFPFLGVSDARPPFLAPAKEPSMEPSVRSRPPRSRRSFASARRTASRVPS